MPEADYLLNDNDLIRMRATLEKSLPGTAVVQSRSFASDGGGGGTSTFTASGTVDCRVSPIGGGEDATGERVSPDADWVITLPASTSIDREDRIVSNSVTYEVKALRAPRDWELSRRVECAELT